MTHIWRRNLVDFPKRVLHLALHFYNIARLMMEYLKIKKRSKSKQQSQKNPPFYSKHSSSLSKHGAYIANVANLTGRQKWGLAVVHALHFHVYLNKIYIYIDIYIYCTYTVCMYVYIYIHIHTYSICQTRYRDHDYHLCKRLFAQLSASSLAK